MTSKACTPDNVIGRMLGMREANGHAVTKELIDELDGRGKLSYADQTNLVGADLFDGSDIKGEKAVINHPQENMVKRILTDQAGVDEILDADLVDDLDGLIREHMTGGGTKYDFADEAKDILEAYRDNYTGTKSAYFQEYYNWMVHDGGPLYQIERRTGVGQAMSNLADNTIKSSFTVALGNPIELALKLPALYRDDVAEGVSRWLSNGDVFRKIPELEKIGFYGLERREITDANMLQKLNKKWSGLNEIFDIPWKNLAYHTGAVKGGMEGGLKAVEDVLFIPRMANMPRQRWANAGRIESRFLSYSINSIKLGADLLKRASQGDMDAMIGIAIIGGGMTAFGGPGSLIPKPVEDFLEASGDWENPLPKWGASGLVQQQGVGRAGIVYDIGTRQGQKIFKSATEAAASAMDGDIGAASVNLAHSLMGFAAFTNSFWGDAAVQKGMGIARDLVLDDMDGDLAEEAQETFFPFTVER